MILRGETECACKIKTNPTMREYIHGFIITSVVVSFVSVIVIINMPSLQLMLQYNHYHNHY